MHIMENYSCFRRFFFKFSIFTPPPRQKQNQQQQQKKQKNKKNKKKKKTKQQQQQKNQDNLFRHRIFLKTFFSVHQDIFLILKMKITFP